MNKGDTMLKIKVISFDCDENIDHVENSRIVDVDQENSRMVDIDQTAFFMVDASHGFSSRPKNILKFKSKKRLEHFLWYKVSLLSD